MRNLSRRVGHYAPSASIAIVPLISILLCHFVSATSGAEVILMNVYTDKAKEVYFDVGGSETKLLKYGEETAMSLPDDTTNLKITLYEPGTVPKDGGEKGPPTELATATLNSLRVEEGGNAVFAYKQGRRTWRLRTLQGTGAVPEDRLRFLVANFSPSRSAHFKIDGVAYTRSRLNTNGGTASVDTTLQIEGEVEYQFADQNNKVLAKSDVELNSVAERGRAIVAALYGSGANGFPYQFYLHKNVDTNGGGGATGAIVGGVIGGLVVIGAIVGVVVIRKRQGGGAPPKPPPRRGGKVTLPAGGGGGGGLVGATAAAPPIPARDTSAPPVPARDAPPPIPSRDNDAPPPIPSRV